MTHRFIWVGISSSNCHVWSKEDISIGEKEVELVSSTIFQFTGDSMLIPKLSFSYRSKPLGPTELHSLSTRYH